ncbi:hypothetical protein [Paracoccus sulfuroxidans]|uniref:Uncharacterized protein n=1 Tax=Paracoccus sulfuroxidans TaxID=384678 RepID=A0A562NKN5_9RHOB|nr:hypothetical protein [Paracoccus sulfuroxidans]TWI32777.1 hypothetical protein IQ24_02652 [Paracoccus sulfuroxidans]
MNAISPIGHNNPPDAIDEITARFDDARAEAENWLDGNEVQTEGQMKAVDALRKDMREFRMALEAGQKSSSAPLYDAYKAEHGRWKPTLEDAQRIEKGLVALVDSFKRKLAAEKAEAERKARAEAAAARRAAEEAARAADASNIEAQREAAAAQFAAEEAQRRAVAASKDTVKGLRTFEVTEVLDPRGLINWIAKNRKDDLAEWMGDYARRNKLHIPGVVETRQERRAV